MPPSIWLKLLSPLLHRKTRTWPKRNLSPVVSAQQCDSTYFNRTPHQLHFDTDRYYRCPKSSLNFPIACEGRLQIRIQNVLTSQAQAILLSPLRSSALINLSCPQRRLSPSQLVSPTAWLSRLALCAARSHPFRRTFSTFGV